MARTILSSSAGALALVLGLAVMTQTAAAQSAATFDFENQATGQQLQELTLSSEGLTATITRPGTIFTVAYRSTFAPEWGLQALSPFIVANSQPMPFVIDFSRPVDRVSIDSGDFGDDDDVIHLTAYDHHGGTGKVVAATQASLLNANLQGFSYVTLAVAGGKIRSVTVVGGSPNFPNSVFHDNLHVEWGTGRGSKHKQ